eukprot:GHVN01048891.1.p1 GENE.GHVN01048891.1~~GHVN01048891.1.p1  ORF type:complete len:304 (-),score=46.24 GHVN01048891.1:744-1547(-)
MGIQGLLGALDSRCKREAHISEFSGQRAAIDAYAWLHRGAYSCASALVRGEAGVTRHLQFCLSRIDLLKRHNVTPVVVFDGMALPSKQGTDEQRRRTREAAAAQGIALHRVGRIKEAEKLFTKAVTITAETAASLIRALSLQGIEVIVAPYEADAQLAYLSRQGLVDVVISEDSDLLPFGCRSVFYKLDHNGGGYEIEWNSLTQQSGLLPPCFFTLDNLISLCVLSGCDYLQSVSGVGVKTAAKMMQACNCNVDQVSRVDVTNKVIQ